METLRRIGIGDIRVTESIPIEDLRKETGQDRFAIMACGLNCWIAMRYASLHPASVSHMVLIGPPLIITQGQIDELVGTLDESLSDVARELSTL